MSLINTLLSQLRSHWRIYAISYAVLAGLLYFIAEIAAFYDISVAYFMRDPAITLYGHPFVGVISNIGVLFWCAAMAVCFFCAYLHLKKGNQRFCAFMFSSGLFTLLLMLDDLFMFHEYLFPYSLGIAQEVVIAAYPLLLGVYLVSFRRLILSLEYMILIIACGFFGLSIALDIWMPQDDLQFLLEDGAKLFGIVTWFIFFSRTAYIQTVKLIER